jgi:hypothetical protein
MRELLGGKGTISLLGCSAANAPNNDLYTYVKVFNSSFCGRWKIVKNKHNSTRPGLLILEADIKYISSQCPGVKICKLLVRLPVCLKLQTRSTY